MRVETVVQWIALAAPILFILTRRGRAFVGLALRALVQPVGGLNGFLAGGSRITLLLGSWLVVWACFRSAMEPSRDPKMNLVVFGTFALVPLFIIWRVTIRPMIMCWLIAGSASRASKN